jgi:hypothetical protein
MLTDLLGYFRRNSKKMKDYDLRKAIVEIKQIQCELERNLKMRGVI